MSSSRPDHLLTPHGRVRLPAFFPDATRGAVRGLDAEALDEAGVAGLVVNAYHLGRRPGSRVISSLGGIHAFMGWNGPVASDSGGFQILSLLREGAVQGTVSASGFRFGPAGDRKKLTPEKSMARQLAMGSDLCVCLDHCTHHDEAPQAQRASVEHTVTWARACKSALERHRPDKASRPLLFAVVQGGRDVALRRECAERLLELGFDGYAFGGWPVDEDGNLVAEAALVAELIPPPHPLWGLGVGMPHNLARAAGLGYGLFDCTLPTRDGRHGRLYVRLREGPAEDRDTWGFVHFPDPRHVRSREPITETCPCPLCRTYSRAYLNHLFTVRDPLAGRLATQHNLRFFTDLAASLAGEPRS